jgi:hypothetical protein
VGCSSVLTGVWHLLTKGCTRLGEWCPRDPAQVGPHVGVLDLCCYCTSVPFYSVVSSMETGLVFWKPQKDGEKVQSSIYHLDFAIFCLFVGLLYQGGKPIHLRNVN